MNAMIKRTLCYALGALALSLPLSGCLVKKKDVETYSRTTDTLRIYQPGDQIVYDFWTTRTQGSSTPQRLSGTLTVRWQEPQTLQDPFDSNTYYDVLKQTFTFLNNGGDTNINPGVVRYIQQDETTGAVSVVAVDSGTERFWFNTNGGTVVDAVSPMTFFDSPLNYTDEFLVNFHIMGGCEKKYAICDTDNSIYTNSINILGDTESITSNYLGKFENPIKISLEGSIQPFTGGEAAPLLDILQACYAEAPPDSIASHVGSIAYIFPEIGPIRIENFCYSNYGNDLDQTTYTIRSANWW